MLKQPKITAPIPLMAKGGKVKKPPIPRVSTPALDALYYGIPMRQDVVSEREAGPRELLAEKLQAQFERFGFPKQAAKESAGKITGYGYPMGVVDITPAGIPLWAYEGGQELARAGEAAGRGDVGEAALSGVMGALNLAPAAPAVGALGKAAGKGVAGQIERAMMSGEGPLAGVLAGARPQFAVAYHGSPHKFEKFDISKIGTGEGAQAYGHGLYFAESPGVAGQYKASTAANMYQTTKGTIRSSDLVDEIFKEAGDVPKGLESSYRAKANEVVRDLIMGESSQEIANKIASSRYGKTYAPIVKAIEALSPSPAQGALYKVDIPDEAVARMLDWDKPLSEQPEVMRALKKSDVFGPNSEAWKDAPKGLWERNLGARTGAEFYNMNRWADDQAKGSAILQQAGIPGIKYLDEGSRAAGEGTRNFVLFSDELPRILEVNEKPTGAKPWALGEWGRAPFQYPQAEALETARKNAVTMLGLPESNTAMDRARALGVDVPTYHATPEDWQIPNPEKSIRSAYGAGLHSAVDPELANVFARQSESSQVMPLLIKKGKTADAATFRKYADELGYDMKKVTEALRRDGYETVEYPHGQFFYPSEGKLVPSTEGQDIAYASLNPSNIRSRFAAFDPARINEADLLGYASPEILPYVAGAGALGGLGLAAIKDEQPKKGKKNGK